MKTLKGPIMISNLLSALLDPTTAVINGEERTEPSRLDLLRESIFQSHEQGSGSAGFGPRSPISTAVFALFDQIEDEAAALFVGLETSPNARGRERGLRGQFWAPDEQGRLAPTDLTWQAVEAFTRVEPRIFPMQLSDAIRGWAEDAPDEATPLVAAILRRWIDQIDECLGRRPKIDYYGIADPDTGDRVCWVAGRLKSALYAEADGGRVVVTSRVTGRTWSSPEEIAQLRYGVARAS